MLSILILMTTTSTASIALLPAVTAPIGHPDDLLKQATERLIGVHRVNVRVELPPSPTDLQTTNYCRGRVYAQSHKQAPAAFDFDGTSVGTCATLQTTLASARYIFWDNLAGAFLRDRKPSASIERHYPTIFRIGLVDYFLGIVDETRSGIPFATYGWSERPAMMAYSDAAMRASFLGPDYLLEKPIEAAKIQADKEDISWDDLPKFERDRRVIAQIERDLLNAPNFLVTSHLREVAERLIERLEGGPTNWEQKPWSDDEIEVLKHLYHRRPFDFFNPGGFGVTTGAKSPAVARLAGKPVVAEALERCLADDGAQHLRPHVTRGFRGVHVDEGRTFFLGRDPVKTLSKESLGDVKQTEYLLDAIEDGPNGLTQITPHSDSLRTHPGVVLTDDQKELTLRLGTVPPGYPIHMDYFGRHGTVPASIKQYFGERIRIERAMVNFARHGTLSPKPPLHGISLLSAIEMAVAGALPHLHDGPHLYQAGIAAVFFGLGWAQERFAGRHVAGSLYRMSLTTWAMMCSGLLFAQAISPSQSLHPISDMKWAALLTMLQILIQRSLIPMALVRNTEKAVKQIADHRNDKDFRTAIRTLIRGRKAAAIASFVATTAMLYGAYEMMR